MESCWLSSEEQGEVADLLLRYPGMIKFDNKRQLPLKSGGKTDIYINLRNVRSYPELLGPLARTYANPLFRLNPKRFTEVPDSMSPIAAVLAQITGIPYFTIRGEAKEGRVTQGNRIGDANYGETITVIDDVITDGASKIMAWEECQRSGLRLTKLIVLVDRQQGWQKRFAEMKWDIRAGMTLHDMRRHLIGRGLMERCSQQNEQNSKLVLALDKFSWDEILPIVDPLRPMGCILKVNDLARELGADWLVPNLSVYGRVMLDFKLYDIPNTVANDCARIKKYSPWAVTVHASGGVKMMKAAVKALEGSGTKVLAITVLTSFDEKTCEEVYHSLPKDQVLVLAALANEAGCQGVVCSPQEASLLRPLYPSMLLVTPGVRSPGVDTHDQERVLTPAGAIEAGADYIVGGRQFLKEVKDPVAEVMRVHKDELGITLS